MSYTGLNDIDVITTAIRRDLATVTSVSVGDYSVADFDKHDPLGIAFYVYALLRTGYTNIEVELFPKTARYWVEEKTSKRDFSPYLDRDLGALGLFTYALCKFRDCPPIQDELIAIIDPYFN